MNLNFGSILEGIGLKKENSVGYALSGGGARGFSHIGVLMAFERFGIRPDIMSGVSAGSIAGVLYGAGLTPKEMSECFAESSGISDFTAFSIPKAGFMKLDRFGKLLESWLPVKNLEELKIPMVVCATDFDAGKSIGWVKGEIVPRVLASCSIPVIFKPVNINGVDYVDGGVLRNLPAWAIRDHCKTLYGCNASPLRKSSEKEKGIFDIAYRTFHLMLKANMPQDMKLCDYVINVHSVTGVKAFEISALQRGIVAGYEAASRVLEKIL